jgi:polyisoprenoid-binding protein YceI
MRKALPLLALSALALAACQTSSLTDAEKAEITQTETPFDGSIKGIDAEQSVISFVGGSDVVDHEGKFTTYTASVDLDETEPANLEKATITADIDLTSVKTDSAGLDGHMQKADFFNTASGSTATFASTSIVAKGDNMYDVTGDLTLKGQTKSITLEAEITNDYLLATYDFPRKEWGIGNDSYKDKLLDEFVPVTVKLVFVK